MPPPENAALDALAAALAPRIYAELKRLAAADRKRDADDSDTDDFLASLGARLVP